ncbi:probable ADP-ribosylation factor GTPase-activating protein AGD14 [Lolium rigidum]|uniref:probable ADP-ribosylation factor GTPase-activating protein AGD14 n=1 Tax=Lolium rigidum TaxID=89674 RepID=UPI001F5D63F1|nr:probable ADP-ribosylation factor GTPase-activating protein AGD14 [Lolium rigidum]
MAAASRKEEERNERIVRGLLKLPPNRRCINCNGIGPQYVCTSFWTFICISCSGIHREFTHRVKSVSMSKFTAQEVEALQKGGNQRARESFLKNFDTQQMQLPDSSNFNSLREFIRVVYVERRYAGVRSSDKPPRDNKQIQKPHEEEHRRSSSYHSFSQSPPNDYQYEERRSGKQPAMLTRKPGSDRGHDGKMSYRSTSLQERMSEDQLANEIRELRTSDCSGSSVSDTVRTVPESPNFFDNGCSSAPFQQNQSDMLNSNGITQSQRTASTENIDTTMLKSGNSSLADLFFGSETAHGTQESNNFIAPSFVAFSDAVNGAEEDFFSRPNLQQQFVTGLYPSVDFFANMPPTTSSSDKIPLEAPSLDNAGWATFDTPPKDKQPGVTGPSLVASIDKQTLGHDLFLFEPSDRPASFLTSKDKVSVINQSGATSHDSSCSQLWHSFDDATGVMINDHSTAGPLCNEHQNVVNVSLGTSNPFTCSVVSEESQDDDCHKVFMEELAPSAPFAAFLEPSLISAAPSLGRTSADKAVLNPFDLPFDTDSEAPGLFMDVSTLQAALPNLPSSFLDGLPESWFSNNTCTYVPSGSHGGLSCLAEQAPNSPLRNIALSTVSTGNPFA